MPLQSDMSLCLPPWPAHWPEIESAILESLRSGDWGRYFTDSHSRLVDELQKRFQVSEVRLCSSGTAAIEMSLRAAGVTSDDEVIACAFDYPGNVRSIEAIGAKPVLVDAHTGGLAPTAELIGAAASGAVRAVIVSHLFGQAANIEPIRRLCDQQDWTLIEDACQVPGMILSSGPELDAAHDSAAERPSRLAGTVGHLGTLSFGGSKPLTSGNGGAVLTSDPRLAARLKSLFDRPSDTFPLSGLQATTLLPQLLQLERLNQLRCETATRIVTDASTRLSTWQPITDIAKTRRTCFYKLAFLAQSPEHRANIIRQANALGIPIGEGFRSMHRMSERRCRRSGSLERSAVLGEALFVLDHRALMVDPRNHDTLMSLLSAIHDQTQP